MQTPEGELLSGLGDIVAMYCRGSGYSPCTQPDALASATILPRKGRPGVVLLMPSYNLVLKVYRGPNNGISNELAADLVAREAGLSEWLPDILGTGQLAGQRHYIVQTFAKKEEATPRITSRRWRHFCVDLLWPALLRLHKVGDPQLVSFDSSIKKLNGQIEGHPNRELLVRLLSWVESHAELSLDSHYVTSKTHGDIVPEHIRISSSNIKIIDWGSFARRPTIAEYCLRFTRSAHSFDFRASQFWTRLRVDAKPLPRDISLLTQDAIEWQRMHFGLNVDAHSVKAQLVLDFCNSAVWRWGQIGRDLSARKYRQRVQRMGLGGAT